MQIIDHIVLFRFAKLSTLLIKKSIQKHDSNNCLSTGALRHPNLI